MLAVAWATLPDLPTYREGVIMVGLARYATLNNSRLCANEKVYRNGDDLEPARRRRRRLLCHSSHNQFDPSNHPLLPHVTFLHQRHLGSKHVNASIWKDGDRSLYLSRYSTRCWGSHSIRYDVTVRKEEVRERFLTVLWATRSDRFAVYVSTENMDGADNRIILIFAGQATRILDNIGDVFRVVVPMVVYFVIMWTSTFFLVHWLSRRRGGARKYGYKMAVVQSFTAGSNK
jgi:ACR3 family arsenite transporter